MRIRVTNFSCVKSANFELGIITLLIGPQASGKSVLCKLNYFCLDALKLEPRLEVGAMTYEDFKASLKTKFYEWFPLSAWGSEQFLIEFQAGQVEIRISRTVYKNKPTENLRIWASDSVRKYFADVSRYASGLKRKSKDPEDFDSEFGWRTYEYSRKALAKLLGPNSVDSQIFIPAGRSFFTSIGKAVAAFEHGRVLDPLTLTFGRMFASMRDHRQFYWARSGTTMKKVATTLNGIFGGEIKSSQGAEYVLTTDGRKVPLSALSSGQQELLPLMTVLPFARVMRDEAAGSLFYIEEPEAHLFPKAQSQLVEALASLVNLSHQKLWMVLTTHSPYVLSKFNNLVKAGQLGQQFKDGEQFKAKRNQLEKLVPTLSQVPAGYLQAYAIVDGELTSIVDEDGMIDAGYLDSVSGDISTEFSELLSLEYAE